MTLSFFLLDLFPRDPIRPVDPIEFLSDSCRPESDPDFVGIRQNAMKSNQIRPWFHRIPLNSDEIRVGFRPIGIRQKPCRIRQKLFRSGRIRPPMNLLGIHLDKINVIYHMYAA